MGATIIADKRVGAFRASNGQIGYVLFEEKYEKNCYPHNPRWSCVAMGYVEEVIAWIFLGASGCEGGSTQSRSGYVRPEAYVTDWIAKLAQPVHVPNLTQDVKIEDRFDATIPETMRKKVLEGLVQEGYTDQAKVLSEGALALSLHHDFDVLRAIYVKHSFNLGPWRFLDRDKAALFQRSPVAPELAYVHRKERRRRVPHLPSMALVYHETIAFQDSDGAFRIPYGGRDVVSGFIREYWTKEMDCPGSFRGSMKRFREAVKGARMVGDDTVVSVSGSSLPQGREDQLKQIENLALLLKKTGPDFEFTVAEFRAVARQLSHPMWYLVGLDTLVWRPKNAALTQQQAPLHGVGIVG